MTREQVAEAIESIIVNAVLESGGHSMFRNGGNFQRSYRREINEIFQLMGKLSPEHEGNIKEVVPNYNKHLIKKVGKQKMQFTVEQRAAAKAVLRKLGMI